jgi:hypothetical protein
MMDPDGASFRSLSDVGVPQVLPTSPHSEEWGGVALDIPAVAKVFYAFPPLPASLGASQRGGSSNSSSTLLSVVVSSPPLLVYILFALTSL